MTLPILTAEEQRVLGCLLEKEITVPESYPLTLNALRTACNQKSSREPVVEYDERTIQDAVRSLKDRGLARVTWMDYGKRTLKYAQSLVEELELEDDERAVLTVLLLRGEQEPGELKTRTDRLHRFDDRADVEATLQKMAGRAEPLVVQLERKTGQQDNRWQHLLGDAPVAAALPAVDKEQVLADGVAARDQKIIASYNSVAGAYAETFGVVDRPFEQWFLTRVAELAGPHRTADVGCGPGGPTAFLAEAGADPVGFDISPEMIEVARSRFPELEFEVADLRRLLRPNNAAGWGAVVANHSLVHFAPSELPGIIRGLVDTLLPDGILAIILQVGNEVLDRTEFLGEEIDLSWVRHDPADVRRIVESTGLTAVETYIASDDRPADRLYLIAGRP